MMIVVGGAVETAVEVDVALEIDGGNTLASQAYKIVHMTAPDSHIVVLAVQGDMNFVHDMSDIRTKVLVVQHILVQVVY